MNSRTSSVLVVALFGCLAFTSYAAEAQSPKEPAMNIQLTTTAFSEAQPIPVKYTCSGQDVSPPLKWSNAPAGTKSFALIVDDPDAPVGIWTHWVIFNLPPTTTSLPENMSKSPELPDGAKQGMNDFHHIGYGGPCPPRGYVHHYHLQIYALDAMLDLKSGATRKELLKAMEGHILGEGRLIGTFQRERK